MPEKRLLSHFIFFLLFGHALAEEPPKPVVSVKVLSLTEQPMAGEALDLVLLVKNESQDLIGICTHLTPADYSVVASYKDGSLVPSTAYARWLEEGNGGGRRMFTQNVEPGERYMMLIRVSEVVDLSKEDEYTIKISLKNVCNKAGKSIPVIATSKFNLSQKSFDFSSQEMKRAREMAKQDGRGKVVEPGRLEFNVEPAPDEGEKKK